jgi:hypothetical protein
MLADHNLVVADLMLEHQVKEIPVDLELLQEILVELVVVEVALVVLEVLLPVLEILQVVLVVLVFNYQHHLEIQHQR